jgi:lipid II:glycine glycyltransferase (peptidoglycan interpeptide bridge formation enzyme)
MRLGASQLLIFEVATRLAAEGLSVFNLGGAEPTNEGLYRFKVGFGTSARELEAASYQVGSAVRRGVLWLAESARAVFRS